MKIHRTIGIAVFSSALLTTAFRVGSQKWNERLFNQIGADACEVLIPMVQVGSTKNVFEEAQSILRRHLPESGFAVEVIENGTTLFDGPPASPSWYNVSCKIPGRANVAVNFDFKSATVWDWSLALMIGLNSLWMGLLVTFFEWVLKMAFAAIQERSFHELSNSLGLAESPPSRSIWAGIIRWLIASPSVQNNLRAQIEALKVQIATQEKRNLELIASKIEKEQALTRTNEFLEIVHQIQHDIQGPLVSLAGLIEMNSVDEKDRQILTALFHKVQGMVVRLAVQEQVANPSLEGIRDYIAEALIKEVVREKRVTVTGKPIDIELEFEKSKLNLVQVDSLQFSRMISNLIQNAIEALPGHGKITVSVRGLGAQLFVVIADTGRGIAADKLPLLFSKGATFGKPGGKGYGLYHAMSCLKRWNGDISIESTVGEGTTIYMQIPISPTSASAVGEIVRDDVRVNVVVDDDIEVFSTLQPQLGTKSLYFATPEDLQAWQEQMAPTEPIRYIVDFSLGSNQTGVDLITRLGSPHSSILITKDYNRAEVIEASSQSGFQIFPKIFLPAV